MLGPEDDYTQKILRHARIYVFADYHGIERLQFLAVQKLRRALTTFQLYPVACDDITQLVQYCFNKTVDKGESSGSSSIPSMPFAEILSAGFIASIA